MSDLLPFLSAATPSSSRPLATTLREIPTGGGTSPWSPKPATEPLGTSSTDLEALRAEACERGRADGLRETAKLRERLAALVDELETARDALIAPTAELISDAATAVVSAWTENANHTELFAPIVRSWVARCQTPAVAHVHPGDADAMRAAIEGAAITIEADEHVARGDVKIRGVGLELAHEWGTRLRELREAIATALEVAP